MFRKTTIAAIMLASTTFTTLSYAADEHNTVPGLTAAGASLGLHGYDPVAFIDIGNRIDGAATYTSVHDGVAYYFSSEANLKAFEKNPSRYTPQNGGFCTYGVSVGKKFDGDPRYAAIEGDKLYVFLNEQIFREFQKDKSGTISKASTNWAKIKHSSAASL